MLAEMWGPTKVHCPRFGAGRGFSETYLDVAARVLVGVIGMKDDAKFNCSSSLLAPCRCSPHGRDRRCKLSRTESRLVFSGRREEYKQQHNLRNRLRNSTKRRWGSPAHSRIQRIARRSGSGAASFTTVQSHSLVHPRSRSRPRDSSVARNASIEWQILLVGAARSKGGQEG